ncbi:hypothetical protein ACFLZZ_02790 [Nanoarchaeota archaeon]
MILVINICKDKLSEIEFVRPVQMIVKRAGFSCFIKHYTELYEEDIEEADKIIICGTALQDFDYLENITKFEWIKNCKKPILGICAGMQIIGKTFGCEIYDNENIGQADVKTSSQNDLTDEDEFYAYFLNNKTIKVSKDFEVLVRGKEVEGMIKHKSKRIWGTLFHPEVMNSDILVRFCEL